MKVPAAKPPVDYGDIQGLVRFAHGQLAESAFVLMRVRDAALACQWLDETPVTTAESSSPRPGRALQLAFSAAGLQALGLDEALLKEFSSEFSGGICGDENRSRRLGDIAANHPAQWLWGGTSQPQPHVLIMLYTGSGELRDQLQTLRQGLFKVAFEELSVLRSKSAGPEEAFGFVDGISQPAIDWQQHASTDAHRRDSYSNSMALGEVLLGYPNEYGLYTPRPLLEAGDRQGLPAAGDEPARGDLGRNGSYLVLRQLDQDVTGFWNFVDSRSASDTAAREQLAAAMVGRQRDGSPLVAQAKNPIAGIAAGHTDNQFNFDHDPHGQQCPVGAHIRRANPRTGDFPAGVSGLLQRLLRILGFGRRYLTEDLVASSRFHRILRRGRAYGSTLTPSEERGLFFVCLGANISRQFEFVQNAWCMSAKFSGLPNESDPLLGNREPLASGAPTNHFSQPQAGKPAHCTAGLPQFVTVRGGGYFFLPGIRALHFIARQGRTTVSRDSRLEEG